MSGQAPPVSGLSSSQPELIDWIITSSHAALCHTSPHCSLGPEVNEAGRDHCRSITADRSPSVRALERMDAADSGLKALNVWPAAGCLDCSLHNRHKTGPYSSGCCAGLCCLIRLTSFPLPFLSSLESNKDRMTEGKDQACFQVQLHPIISYLSSLIPHQSSGFNPAPVFGAYKAELCL